MKEKKITITSKDISQKQMGIYLKDRKNTFFRLFKSYNDVIRDRFTFIQHLYGL